MRIPEYQHKLRSNKYYNLAIYSEVTVKTNAECSMVVAAILDNI